MRLYEKLIRYVKQGFSPFHMPGHKRRVDILKNTLPYNLDITEIPGFDDLQNPVGILLSCQKKASRLYNTKATFYSVNGATGAIFSAITAVCNSGDKIIVARNCHKSVFNISEILNLNCVILPFILGENGIFSHFDLKVLEKIVKQNRDAKCIVITSPTYEGVMVNVSKIAQIAHKNKILLIVDEAHGSHLFLENKSAVSKGADIVIDSIHKTLPSLTQTALLHICTQRVNMEKIKKYVSVFNSSSPSYILMSSIDECIEFLLKNGKKYYKKLKDNLKIFYENTKNLKNLQILRKEKDFFDFDNTKITILTTKCNITGKQLSSMLRKNKIEIEMAYDNYCTCICTIFDKKSDFALLTKVLSNIDKKLKNNNKVNKYLNISHKSIVKIGNIVRKNKRLVDLNSSQDLICAEYVWVSPPCVPILIPGENITKDIICHIHKMQKTNTAIFSSSNALKDGKIYVLKRKIKKGL